MTNTTPRGGVDLMDLRGPTLERSAAQQIDRATLAVREARRVNEGLQQATVVSSPQWQTHARVDDLLFEALNALGE